MALMTWQCPSCEYEQDREGTCPNHFVPLQPVRPEPVPETQAPQPEPRPEPTPPGTLALDTPWGFVDVPGNGWVDIGRSTPAMAGPRAQLFTQVSRRHVRLTADPGDPRQVMVTDLGSSNGTYLNGSPQALTRGEHGLLRPGQQLRLGEDVDCTLQELDEFGVPLAPGRNATEALDD